MCFSILQVPRCRIHTLASSLWKSFHSLNSSCKSNSSRKLLASTSKLDGGYSRRWNRKPITTETEGRKAHTQTNKPSQVKDEILDGTVSNRTKISIGELKINEFQEIQYSDIQRTVAKNRDVASLVTVIVFDIETTGLSRENERIIEIALQDLSGGENSTFQTLVNPGRYIPNSHVHGITTHMVNRRDVPRMGDFIPILLQYIRSRQKPGGYVLWVAHNARCFDVPFLIKEFSRCHTDIPSDWRFFDTLSLARELMKSGGSKLPSKISLQALREYYSIPLVGSAHRAMSDVYSLSMILQRMTFDLKMPVSSLLERSFKATDLISAKKKKTSS